MPDHPVTAYFNGEFIPLAQVCISPLDRGFLFADSVYEVIPAYRGQLFRLTQHLERLGSSLREIDLESPHENANWSDLLNQLVQLNGGGDLAVYLQVTRGAAPVRDHGFPPIPVPPTVFAMAHPLKPLPEEILRHGIAAVTQDDIRWGSCHIKSTALLANVLARQASVRRGAADAILVRDGHITEAAAANVFLVCDGVLLTPPKSPRILPGITRDLILELAVEHALAHAEQDLPVELLEHASEVWVTSSTREIVPITKVDGRPVGDGAPGPLWQRMRKLYEASKRRANSPSTNCA
jgi:D-alanine transaminase